MDYIEQLYILLHLVISFILAGLLGYERDRKDKPAGLKTNMLIAGSACLMIMLGDYLIDFIAMDNNPDLIRGDPTRLLNAIIVGVSFIGGGTILKSAKDNTVSYLTTAATLLLSTCIGVSIALELYVVGVGIAILGLFINYTVGWAFSKNLDNESH